MDQKQQNAINGNGQTPRLKPYEKPDFLYEGELTTRAGSKYPGDPKDYDVDPAQLFGGAS